MKAELENKLIEKYRELFPPDDIWHDETKSCMAWGLAVGDGWYDILDRAFAKFMLLENKPQLAQVKEKFGTLRLYLDNSSDEAYEIASKAEYESETTCEICGKTGKLVGVGWYSTRCEDHKNGYKSAIS